MAIHPFPAYPVGHLSEGSIQPFQLGNGKISPVNGGGGMDV
jgi:hypothetical protein